MHASDSLYKRMSTTQTLYKDNHADPELEHKVKRVSDKFSETMNVVANEPSLAFFRIQEHVRKTLPQLVDTKHEVEDIQAKVQGSCFDADYAINAVKAMQSSSIHFQNMQDLLKNAMFMKQQISFADNRRRQGGISPTAGENKLPTTSTQTIPWTPDVDAIAVSAPQSEAILSAQSSTDVPERGQQIGAEELAINKEVEELMANMQSKTVDQNDEGE